MAAFHEGLVPAKGRAPEETALRNVESFLQIIATGERGGHIRECHGDLHLLVVGVCRRQPSGALSCVRCKPKPPEGCLEPIQTRAARGGGLLARKLCGDIDNIAFWINRSYEQGHQ